MKRWAIALFSAAVLLGPVAPAHASDYDGRDRDGGYSYRHHRDGRDRNGNDGDCQSGGCGNRSRRCEGSSGDCRSSFSPGPFKDSPVTIWFCPQQNSCNQDGHQGQNPQPGESPRSEQPSPACLLAVPYHCDQPRQAP